MLIDDSPMPEDALAAQRLYTSADCNFSFGFVHEDVPGLAGSFQFLIVFQTPAVNWPLLIVAAGFVRQSLTCPKLPHAIGAVNVQMNCERCLAITFCSQPAWISSTIMLRGPKHKLSKHKPQETHRVRNSQ
jgi:hypothetical protein